MSKRTHIPVLILAGLLSFPCLWDRLWADEKPTEPTENCTEGECHNSLLQKRTVHKPVAHGVCKFCHDSVDPKEHSFKLYRTGNELCGNCHREQTVDLKIIPSIAQLIPKAQVDKGKYFHEPMEEGQCIDCHNPHSSDYKYLVTVSPVSELCRECHEIFENTQNAHEPFAEGDCAECHKAHSSNYRNLLIDSERPLCLSCHEDTRAELESFKYSHKPVVDMECGYCHGPHGSDYFRLLIKRYSPEFYAPFDISNFDLCFSCHREDIALIEETDNLTDFRNGQTNLHYLHVNMPEKGRTCRTCHAAHASNEYKQIRDKVPYGGWEIPINFEKTETGGGCVPGCHNPRIYNRIKPVIYKSDKNP